MGKVNFLSVKNITRIFATILTLTVLNILLLQSGGGEVIHASKANLLQLTTIPTIAVNVGTGPVKVEAQIQPPSASTGPQVNVQASVQAAPILTVAPTINTPTSLPQAPIPTIAQRDPTPTRAPAITPTMPVDSSNPQNNILGNNPGQIPVPTIVNPSPDTSLPSNDGSTWTSTPVPTSSESTAIGGTGNSDYQYWNIVDPKAIPQKNESPVFFNKEEFKEENVTQVDILQKENFFELQAEANTRLYLIATTNSCNSFVGMTFKSKEKISGKIFIEENPSLTVPVEDKNNIYSSCKIKLEGFKRESIEGIKLRLRYSEEWENNSNVDLEGLKVFVTSEENKELGEKYELSNVGEFELQEKKYQVVETSLQALPEAYSLASEKDKVAIQTNEDEKAIAGTINLSDKIKRYLTTIGVLMGLGVILALVYKKLFGYKEVIDEKDKPYFW